MRGPDNAPPPPQMPVSWPVVLIAGLLLTGWAGTWWGRFDSTARIPWEIGLTLLATVGVGWPAGLTVCAIVTVMQFANDGRLNASSLSSLLVSLLMMIVLEERRRRWRVDQNLARLDPLTRLFNRQAFREALQAEFSRSARFQRPFAVLMIDCDGFKQINDTRGHLAGDMALQMIAQILRREIRGYDALGRLGGDEFALLLSEAARGDVEHVVERIRTALRHAVERDFPGLTCSIGVAIFTKPPESLDQALQAADEAMYAAKRVGPNQASFVEMPAA